MKDRKLEILSVVGIALILLLFFTFYDLSIAQWIYQPDSGFGWFFQAFGEVPAFFFASLSSAYMISQKDPIMKQKCRRTVLGYGFVLLFSTILGIKTILDYLGIHSYLLLAVLVIGWILLSFEIVKIVPYECSSSSEEICENCRFYLCNHVASSMQQQGDMGKDAFFIYGRCDNSIYSLVRSSAICNEQYLYVLSFRS